MDKNGKHYSFKFYLVLLAVTTRFQTRVHKKLFSYVKNIIIAGVLLKVTKQSSFYLKANLKHKRDVNSFYLFIIILFEN